MGKKRKMQSAQVLKPQAMPSNCIWPQFYGGKKKNKEYTGTEASSNAIKLYMGQPVICTQHV